MIVSKHNRRHSYEELEPIKDERTGRLTGDVMAINVDGYRLHMKLSSMVGTIPEDEELLKALGRPLE